MNNKMLKGFYLPSVQLLNPQFLAGQEAVLSFVRKIEPDRVLSAFRRNAGLSDKGFAPYPGWENARIGGHALGHYFSAAAMAACSLGDEVLRSNLNYIVHELRKCQHAIGNGFLSAASPARPDYPDIQFDIEEGKAAGRTWVPWYALHKVLRGLTDIYLYMDNEEALEAARALADWVADRCDGWDEPTHRRILSTEYGGMNDALYLLYGLTGCEHYKKAAEAFDDPDLYRHLTEDEDALAGVHANTTIPKFIGALRREEVMRWAGAPGQAEGTRFSNAVVSLHCKEGQCGDTGAPGQAEGTRFSNAVVSLHCKEGQCGDTGAPGQAEGAYFSYAASFFRRVVETQMYATGGIGDMEHFRPDRRLDANRTQCNAESCCVYNMMKLARMLYERTGDACYADYMERALFNARLGSVHPAGGTTYFNPMGTGFFKVFGNEDPAENTFWCCTGTGMEDFSKLGDCIYFHEGETLIVNQYISSRLRWPEMGLCAELQADLAGGEPFRFALTAEAAAGKPDSAASQRREIKVRFRIPTWTEPETFGVRLLNGTTAAGDGKKTLAIVNYCSSSRYAEITLILEAGWTAVCEIDCPARLRAEGLPDAGNVLAFTYGPLVLAAELPTDDDKEVAEAGIEVIAPAWKMIRPGAVKLDIEYGRTIRGVLKEEFLKLLEGSSFSELKENPGRWMERDEASSGLAFRLKGLHFRPFNEIVEQRYGIYWYFQ